jgi:hypothetical protein
MRTLHLNVFAMLQVAVAHASLAALDKEHSHVLAQNEHLREQIGSICKQHAMQNEDLQAVLSEAQLALKQLRSEKVKSCLLLQKALIVRLHTTIYFVAICAS